MIRCTSKDGKIEYEIHSKSYNAPFRVVPDTSFPGAEWWSPDTGNFFDADENPIGSDLVFRKESPIGEACMPCNPAYPLGPGINPAFPLDGNGCGVGTCVSNTANATIRSGGRGVNAFEYSDDLEGRPNPKDYPLPERATSGSAGYDIFSPFDVFIEPGRYVQFSLGIKCRIKQGEFLMVVPRSSMGFGGNHVVLTNTVGIIDSDYYGNPTTGGEISIRLKNEGTLPFSVAKGDKLAQAIFVGYDLAAGDCASAARTGGFGSTDGGRPGGGASNRSKEAEEAIIVLPKALAESGWKAEGPRNGKLLLSKQVGESLSEAEVSLDGGVINLRFPEGHPLHEWEFSAIADLASALASARR